LVAAAITATLVCAAIALTGAAGATRSEDELTPVSEAASSKKERKRPGVSKLWSLYPMNPAAGRTPLPTPTAEGPSDETLAAPVERTPPTDVRAAALEQRRREEAAGSPGEASPWTRGAGVAALGLVVVGAAWWVNGRRGRRAALAGPAAAQRLSGVNEQPTLPSAPRVTLRSKRAPGGVTADREHVRIHLQDGRRIEGWKKGGWISEDERVLVLDVESVHDRAGHAVDTTPLDSFVLPPQIERIEKLD
jgi:hypothetical protein